MPLADSIHNLSPFLIRFSENWGIRWYGLSYVFAFIAGYYLLRFLIRRGYSELPEEKLTDFITYCAVFGVFLGGRIGYMLLYSPKEFFANPLIFFRFLDGGMASHGGIAGLTLFTLYFAWRHKLHWRHIGDNLCVVAPMGIAIVRCANFINGELWGNITTKNATPWAMKFPSELHEMPRTSEQIERVVPADQIIQLVADAASVDHQPQSLEQVVALAGENQRIASLIDNALNNELFSATTAIDPQANDIQPIIELSRDNDLLREAISPFLNYRHPSQIYQALLEGLALFLILFAIRLKWKQLPYGILTACFFIFYAIFRIIGEQFRFPDSGNFPGTDLSKGQFYSLFMFGIGGAFIAYAIYERKFKKTPLREGRLDA
ncbi:MAG: phosphatidylglycerol:prolipoprotein diacylglycerol transferase [Pseudoalteromonas tetraodonis]